MFTRLLMSSMLVSSVAFASGFEKTNLMSGRYMGIAGAATSSAGGAEAIYFNPAGLGKGLKTKNEVVGDLSPIKIDFKAPVAGNDRTVESSRWAAAPGLFYRTLLDDKWALGAAFYAAGGNNAEYSEVEYTSALTTAYNLKPNVFTKIEIEELAVGASYKIDDKLSVGFAWRGGFVQADQSAAVTNAANTLLINPQYRGMKGSNMMGYRIGAQYDYAEGSGVGFQYRNALPVAASGKLYAEGMTATGTRLESTETDMSVKTQLPAQFSLGHHHKWCDTFTSFFDYSWTNYAAVDRLIYEGTFTLGGTPTALGDVETGWSDKHVLRLAGEYTGISMPIRFGYAYASQVTSTNFANATYAPPAPSHTLSLGSGMNAGPVEINGAFDYTTFKGSVPSDSNTMRGPITKAGDYQASVIGIHLGATYGF